MGKGVGMWAVSVSDSQKLRHLEHFTLKFGIEKSKVGLQEQCLTVAFIFGVKR